MRRSALYVSGKKVIENDGLVSTTMARWVVAWNFLNHQSILALCGRETRLGATGTDGRCCVPYTLSSLGTLKIPSAGYYPITVCFFHKNGKLMEGGVEFLIDRH